MNQGHRRAFGAPRRRALALVAFAAALLAGCGGADRPSGAAADRPPTKVNITATDYGFDAPDTIEGGTVEISFTNNGREPHFAGVAAVRPGKSFEDVHAALTASAPSPGPPPFEDFAGIPTADPGRTAKATLDLPAGTYALFCLIPSPDGATHAHKGMVRKLTVTAGDALAGPRSVGPVVGTDFGLSQVPELKPGTNVIALRNDGRQLHEINLVELAPGKTVDDVVTWYRQPAGPPPMASLGGVAVRPGEQGVTTLELARGSTYAFICVIPDVLGDFAPHIVKGMFTAPFTVR